MRAAQTLTPKDFDSDQTPRWCPGCGDYAILASIKRALPALERPPHEIVFISGIGCSSRFPYYMNTYGFHTIHGRAPAIASGLKATRPDLDVWIVTGDGDSLSIGGNHLLHLFRRNLNVTLLLFNNQVYGLTKGQYSPTSPIGQRVVASKSAVSSIDTPLNPLRVALGANASMIIRSIDRDLKHMGSMIQRAAEHYGAVFFEIYQDCHIFNKGAFAEFVNKNSKQDVMLYLEHGKPMIFGREQDKAIRLDGLQPLVIDLKAGNYGTGDALVHDEHDESGLLAGILATFQERKDFPRPVGVIRNIERPCYEDMMRDQVNAEMERGGETLQELFESGDMWEVEAK